MWLQLKMPFKVGPGHNEAKINFWEDSKMSFSWSDCVEKISDSCTATLNVHPLHDLISPFLPPPTHPCVTFVRLPPRSSSFSVSHFSTCSFHPVRRSRWLMRGWEGEAGGGAPAGLLKVYMFCLCVLSFPLPLHCLYGQNRNRVRTKESQGGRGGLW